MTQFHSVAHDGMSWAIYYPTCTHLLKITFNAECHSRTSDKIGTGACCLVFWVWLLQTWHWHVTTQITPSQPHVFVCRPECVNDSLVLGIVVKQIAQRKEGMFPQV